jgi:hypothetical protein
MKRTKSTAGKNSVWLSTSVPKDVNREIKRMAKAARLTRCGMARELLTDSVARLTGKPHVGKIIIYPLLHPENPTARAADNAGL